MFNVLSRLSSIKQEDPAKYQRICRRLAEIQHQGAQTLGADDHSRAENYEHLVGIRKATDDFFSRLATVDRHNELFWKHIGNRSIGQTEDDLPKPDKPQRKRKRKLPQKELLIKTILLAQNPQATFRQILEFNHPQRILHKLLEHHDRRLLLYGVRAKFGLPLPSYLATKEHFQDSFSDLREERDGIDDDYQNYQHRSSEYDENGELIITEVRPKRVSSEDTLPDFGTKVDSLDDAKVLEDLIGSSLLYKPEHVVGRPSFHSYHRKFSQFGGLKDSVSQVTTAGDLDPADHEARHEHQQPQVGTDTPIKDPVNMDEEEEQVTFEEEEEEKVDGVEMKKPGQDDKDGGGMDQYRLQRLKIIFEESDTDDEPGLGINEFKQAMKKIIGEDVPEREIELIFMKVDANCDGNVDWNEFLEYTLREFQERDLMTQLTKDTFFEKTPLVIPGSRNPKEICALIYVRQPGFSKNGQDSATGRYYSMNTDGNVICWTADLKKVASFDLIPDVRGKNAYVRANDICAMPEIRVLVVSFTTAEMHFYNYDDTKLELCFSITSMKSPVLCMHYYFEEQESIMLMGDQVGKVSVIRFKNLRYDGLWDSLHLPHSNNPKICWKFLTKRGKAYRIKGILGSDWINDVRYFPTLHAVISCSLDPTYSMCVVPFLKQREPLYFSQKEGFNCFDYNDFLNTIVTGSKNHSIQIWNPDNTVSPSMHFEGHEAGIDQVVMYRDHEYSVVVSLDSGHVLKVWDCKDQACLQTYDAKGLTVTHYATTFMVYNATLEHLVYGARDIIFLKRVNLHRKGPVDKFQKTHDQPIVGALYNELFECVVTGCRESTIMVWNFQTGDKIIQYRNAHSVIENGRAVQVPIKSMCFDANKRRLLTCGSDGLVKLWNFNNGACLSFFAQLVGVDLNAVRYQKNRDLIIAAGWNQYVFMVRDTRGEDEVEETVYEFEKIHRSDIVALELIYAPNNPFSDDENMPVEDVREPDIVPKPDSSYIACQIKRKTIEDSKADAENDLEKSSNSSCQCTEPELQRDPGEAVPPPELAEMLNPIRNSPMDGDKIESTEKNSSLGSNTSNDKSEPFSDSGSVRGTGGFENSERSHESEGSSGSGGPSESIGKSGRGNGSSSGSGSGSGSDESGAEELARMSDDDSLIITASSDGELIVWHLFTGRPVCFMNTDGSPLAMSRKTRDAYAAKIVNDYPRLELKDSGSTEHFVTLQMVQHQRNAKRAILAPSIGSIVIPKLAQQARTCVTVILVLQNRVLNDGKTASVIASSTDGFIRAWSIHHTDGGLVGLFYGAHELDSFVATMCTDEKNELLFTGDTRGYVKVWLLCEWMQSWEHLKDHRHCFDPRHFPFVKRYKMFAPLIAFRANDMMRKTVDYLDPVQWGLYRQPYSLNSFRGHLQRITQMQVVFQKMVIITGSEDCSVRLWHFSGLYIGTLGQPTVFHNDITITTGEKISSTAMSDSGVQSDVSDVSWAKNEDSFLSEDGDPNEVLFQPKVIIPNGLAEKGSLAALQVLYSDGHKRTITPEENSAPTNENVSASSHWFGDKEDYISALQELTVLKNRYGELRPAKFKYHGYRLPYEVKDEETLVFTHALLHKMEELGSLEEIVPANLYQYSLNKVQTKLLESLPADLREPYLELHKAGLLVGAALDTLRATVKARELSLPPPKPPNQIKLRLDKKVRVKEPTVNVKDLDRAQKPEQTQPRRFSLSKSASHEIPDAVHVEHKSLQGRISALQLKNSVSKGRISGQVVSPDPNIQKPKVQPAESDASSGDSKHKTKKSLKTNQLSCASLTDLNVKLSDVDRIDIALLGQSEEEFSENLVLAQERNAKFDYLGLLEQGVAKPSQTDLYTPIIRDDLELYVELQPMLDPTGRFNRHRSLVKKVKNVDSVDSMDRVQLVYKMPDFNSFGGMELHHAMSLPVPPAPRRLPSVVKASAKDTVPRISAADSQELEDDRSRLRNCGWLGDQESLELITRDFHSKKSTAMQHQLGLVIPDQRISGSSHAKAVRHQHHGGKQHVDVIQALRRKARPVLRTHRPPLSNKRLYRQLSESVVPTPKMGVDGVVKAETVSIDLEGYLMDRKAYHEIEEARKRELSKQNEQLYNNLRRSRRLQLWKDLHFPTGGNSGSGHDLSKHSPSLASVVHI